MKHGHGKYHKIPTLWKRASERPCNIVPGLFSKPELELLADLDWEWTEKVDGTNVRVAWDGDTVAFGGKTDKAQMPMHLVEKLDELFGGERGAQLFEQTFPDIAHADHGERGLVTLYGEGYGAKIQKGGGNYNPDGADFALFDVRVGSIWLARENVVGIAEALGIGVVPVVARGSLHEASSFVKEDLLLSAWGIDVVPEGLVCRPPLDLRDRRGNRIICKIKDEDFRKLEAAS